MLAMNMGQYWAKRPCVDVTKFTNTTIEIDTTKPVLVVTSINQPPVVEGQYSKVICHCPLTGFFRHIWLYLSWTYTNTMTVFMKKYITSSNDEKQTISIQSD